MKFILSLLACCILPFLCFANDTLTVEQCRTLALQNSPLQQKKLYAASINALQIRNIQSNSLPRIQVGAQATWQSDVFGLPFNFPGAEIPTVPKDQYKLSVDVAQRIWDGGSDRHLRQQRELERELALAQVEVDAFSLREIVTELYFKTLLLQENETILSASIKDLETRLKQTEASVAEGVALRTAADQIKIQILKSEQQIASTQSDKLALLEILKVWVGREKVDFALQTASSMLEKQKLEVVRPEYNLFALQQRSYQISKDALHLRAQPRIEAFAQGGVGRPNPFNFFETGFEPFLLLGLRAVWTPIDWGNKGRESQIFDLQRNNVDIHRQFFEQRLIANTLKDQQDEAKWQAQLQQDDAIIQLQTDIIARADVQVKNGVMTTTDFLSQLNLLTQAQLTRKTHEIQMVQAREMQTAKGTVVK
jgi:outer membrane protein TolC